MIKLGLSLKVSIPKKQKTISKNTVKIEAKNKKGVVFIDEDGEYKVSLINESDSIHNHTILPFTKRSYDLKGKTSIFTKTKGKYGYTRYVRTEDKAKVFPGDSDIYVPFAPNWIVKGDIINDKGVLKFDFVELLTIKGYNNMTHEDE